MVIIMKDYFYIYDDKNNKIKKEAVLKFNLKGYDSNYLIYKDEDEYFVAKYNGDKIVNLNTDLSDAEIRFCEKILKEYLNNEVKS